MRKVLLLVTLMGCLAIWPSSATAFTGHGCTISTCRYFTSSYRTAVYYYDRRTCSQWKSLSSKYLNGFKTVTALHAKFPHRRLHAAC
jgi:hypothetical protein